MAVSLLKTKYGSASAPACPASSGTCSFLVARGQLHRGALQRADTAAAGEPPSVLSRRTSTRGILRFIVKLRGSSKGIWMRRFLAVFSLSARGAAATYPSLNTNDAGAGSLREAITNAPNPGLDRSHSTSPAQVAASPASAHSQRRRCRHLSPVLSRVHAALLLAQHHGRVR